MYKPKLVLKYDETAAFPLTSEVQYLVQHSDLVEFSKTQEYSIKEGDVIYPLPDVSIPRFKMKMGCDKKGVSITRSSEKANYIIINDLPKHKSSSNLSNQEVTYKHFALVSDHLDRFLYNQEEKIYKTFNSELIEQYNQLKTVIEHHKGNIDIIIDSPDLELFVKFIRVNYDKYLWIGYFTKINFLSLKKPSLASKIRYQDSLLSQINEDSIVITEQKMNELQAMLSSKDEGNIVLAMEMMANSNYQESILNLYLLIVKNLSIIVNQKECNHKNFQSLMNFFGKNLKHMSSNIHNSDVDYIANFLKQYNKLTKESMERLLTYYADTHHQFVGKFCNSVLVSNPDVNFD